MNSSIARHCQNCGQYHQISIEPAQQKIFCSQCRHLWGEIKNPEDLFDYCPICQCRQFYLSKDFNQFMGCLIMLGGIVLVPWTFGLSLPVFAFMDWLLYRRVPNIVNCYRCGTEFRGIDTGKRFKPFLHHIGLKYDKYR